MSQEEIRNQKILLEYYKLQQEKKEKRNIQTPRQGGLDGDRRDKGRKRREKEKKIK